jgi:hypothetical protein
MHQLKKRYSAGAIPHTLRVRFLDFGGDYFCLRSDAIIDCRDAKGAGLAKISPNMTCSHASNGV